MSLNSLKKLFAILSLSVCGSLFAAPLTVNVAGSESVGTYGNAANTVLLFNVGANATLTSVDYALSLTAFSPSWLSEMRLVVTDSSGGVGIELSPGFEDDAPGTASYAESIDLSALFLDFQVGSDGILRLEFYDSFDNMNGADGIWNAGTITFGFAGDATPVPVPEPASALLMGMGVMMIGYGRRRRAERAL